MARNIPYLHLGEAIIDPKTGVPTALFMQRINDILLRTGGETTDAIADLQSAASANVADAAVIKAGVSLNFTLTPTQPLFVTVISSVAAKIGVAAHVRTESGVDTVFPAGMVGDAVIRDFTYYVYYRAAYVGVPIYFATTDAGTAADPINKLIGSIFAAAPQTIVSAFGEFGNAGI